MARGRERGSVTAETAVALPALAVVTVLVAWLLTAVLAEIRCVDAARLAARAVARGEPQSVAAGAAVAAAPRGATVRITRSGEHVRVRVEAAVGPAIGSRRVVQVAAEALAAMEPSVDPPGIEDGPGGSAPEGG